jgi:hypothetical protein
MDADQKRLANAITVLTSRRNAIEEEMKDEKRMKSAPPEVLTKRIADLKKQIDERTAKLSPPASKPKPPPA